MSILGPSKSYLEILDEHLSKKSEVESSQPRRFNPLRPSSSGNCARQLAEEYAQFKGLIPTVQEVISPELQRIFQLGSSIEWMMIKQLEQVPEFRLKYKQQVLRIMKLSDGSWLEGSLDLALFYQGFGVLADWKSKKDNFSSWFRTNWDDQNDGYAKMQTVQKVTDKLFWIDDLPAFLSELKDRWLAKNFYQVNLYATNDFVRESGIDHGAVWQKNKNDSRIREFRFRPSDEIAQQVKDKFNLVHDTVTSATKENINEKIESLRCSKGSNCEHCWADDAKAAYWASQPVRKWAKDTSYLGKTGEELEALFLDYQDTITQMATGEVVHDAIVAKMLDLDETKIRLKNGEVWEAKFLKSPRPHHELRRSK